MPVAGAVALLGFALAGPVPVQSDERLNPIGAWRCLVYGDPRRGDEQLLLSLAADGSAAFAIARESGVRVWLPIEAWTASRQRLEFRDPSTRREYAAELSQPTLGGTWQSTTTHGGWWCNRIGESLQVAAPHTETVDTSDRFPPLVAEVMAMPTYPRQAIREAREGRAVVCFVVEPDGRVADGTVVELSDGAFRRPSINAVAASRFRGWDVGRGARPACRTIDYRLDAVY